MKHEITFTLTREEFLAAIQSAVHEENRYGVLYHVSGSVTDVYPVMVDGTPTGDYRVIWRNLEREALDGSPVTDTAEKVMS